MSIFTFYLFGFSSLKANILTYGYPAAPGHPTIDLPRHLEKPLCGAMDTITSHHSLAKILTPAAEKERELPFAKHVAHRLQDSENEGEKAVLAEVLATLLPECQDVHTCQNSCPTNRVRQKGLC